MSILCKSYAAHPPPQPSPARGEGEMQPNRARSYSRDAMLSILTHPVVLLTLGGAGGTNARYWLGRWIALQHWTEHFPLAIFVINVSGSLLLGLLVLPFRDRLPSWYILL